MWLFFEWILGYLNSFLHQYPGSSAIWSFFVLWHGISPFLWIFSPLLHALFPFRCIYSNVRIREDHPLYGDVKIWMREKWKKIHHTELCLASIRSLGPNVTSDSCAQHLTHYVPHKTTRVFWMHWRPTWIEIVKEDGTISMKISTVGDVSFLTRILDTMHEVAKQATKDCVKLMSADTTSQVPWWWDPWNCVGWSRPTPMHELAIDDTLRTKINAEIKGFLAKGEGQFGILLDGPPGTGKTSLAKAIAAKFHLALYQLSLVGKDGDKVLQLSAKISHGSLLLLEDVDRVRFLGNQGEQSENGFEHPGSRVDLQSFLNILDGVSAPPFAVIIMTANDIKKLPPVLIRPGRIDLHITMGLATSHQIQHIFRMAFKNQNHPDLEDKATKFQSLVPANKLSPASIENFLKKNGRTPDTAIDDAEAWIKSEVSDVEDKRTAWDLLLGALSKVGMLYY